MLASFTSILPSGIGFGSTKDDAKDKSMKAHDPVSPPATSAEQANETKHEVAKSSNAVAQEVNVKKKKERSSNETFIVVRPPPSMSNHPLNLQIQLVPPQAKDRSASTSSNRRSVDFTNTHEDAAFEQGEPLARTTSARSNRSDVSSFYATQSSSSMTSISSYASTASAATGRRMIVPLYNLSAHNVMTNTILDAGTDAKIAKFHKRSLDLLGVAVLEPIEVWPGGGSRGTGRIGNVDGENRLSVTGNLHKTGSRDSDPMHGGNHEALTPTSSAFSLSSAGDSQLHTQEQPVTPTTATTAEFGLSATPTQSSAKKIFGRIFKKKDGTASPGGETTPAARLTRGPLSMLVPPSSPGSRSSFGARLSRNLESTVAPVTSNSAIPKSSSSSRVRRSLGVSSSSTESPSGASHPPILQPPILGIQPTLSSPYHPPLGRAQKYVWVVKKWQKGSDNGILNGVMKGVGAGVGALTGVATSGSSGIYGNGGGGFSAKALNFAANKGPVVGEGLEVRFEWVRGTKGHKRRSTTHGRRSTAFGTGSQTSLGVGEGHVQSASSPAGTAGSRKSLGERVARSSTLSAQGRRSMESRRSTSPAGITSSISRRRAGPATGGSNNRDSRTNSMVSTNASDEQAGIVGDKLSTSPKSNVFVDTGIDDGEESDPEDSETPWSCVLVITSTSTSDYGDHDPRHSRLHSHEPNLRVPQSDGLGIDSATSMPKLPHRTSEGSTGSELRNAGALLRLKLGTLAPAPHHPKVVAQLKVPFPLPDVDVNRAMAIKRIVHASGAISRSPDAENVEGLLLTAEEMKDILCSTGFWVVVREGFGGVGKVNRKGDGWRIRA